MKLCKCGCGTEIPDRNIWVNGHSGRGSGIGRSRGSKNKNPLPVETRERQSIAARGKIHSEDTLESMRDGSRRGNEQSKRYERLLYQYALAQGGEIIREYVVGACSERPQGIARIDVADLTRSIAYEADGPYHQYEKDESRDRYLVEQGWSIVHVLYEELDRLEEQESG